MGTKQEETEQTSEDKDAPQQDSASVSTMFTKKS